MLKDQHREEGRQSHAQKRERNNDGAAVSVGDQAVGDSLGKAGK